ncbi:GTP cyclohydrolase II [Amycolatopsis sp. NPDC059021]|uniref:GTP cyclohydrolase II n=1 Tax=Amycolatopsis sp. NPDC059021 TaxID=3346704 RepID=UPI0036724956
MRAFLPWLRALAALAIIGILVWQLGSAAFLAALHVIDGRVVFAALAIGAVTTVFSAWRWCLVARRLGLRLSLRTAVPDYYRALFLNAVLPAGVLGDVHRAVQHGRGAGDVGRGVRAVLLERTAGQVVMIGAGLAVLFFRPSVVPAEFRDVVTICGVVVVFAAGCLLAAGFTVGRRWAASTSKWRRGLGVTLTDIRAGLLSRTSWPGVAVLSALTLAGYLAMFLVAARAAGSTAPIDELLPLLVLVLLAMGLPVNIGGWGPREGVAALAFGAAGLGAAQGLTVAVVYGVLVLVASLPGAGVLLIRAWADFWEQRAKDRNGEDGTKAMTEDLTEAHLPQPVVDRIVDTRLPTAYGDFRAVGYLDRRSGDEHVALVHGDVSGYGTLVRIHSECLTGDVFSSAHCECGDQLAAALQAIVAEGAGVLVYLRGHEGRGIGLLAKLKAMRLQEAGLDTVDANLALGLPVDARDFRAAAEILRDLGVLSVRLLSNNPHKLDALQCDGIGVVARVPLLVPPNDENIRYLRAKRERLDHYLPHLDEVGT